MKILYISPNQRTQQFPWLIDYQNDSLLCGLKELYGDDVVDCNKKYNLYKDYSDDDRVWPWIYFYPSIRF